MVWGCYEADGMDNVVFVEGNMNIEIKKKNARHRREIGYFSPIQGIPKE